MLNLTCIGYMTFNSFFMDIMNIQILSSGLQKNIIYIFETDLLCILEFFKPNIENRFWSTKLAFEFVFLCWEYRKFILLSKTGIVKLSGIQNI